MQCASRCAPSVRFSFARSLASCVSSLGLCAPNLGRSCDDTGRRRQRKTHDTRDGAQRGLTPHILLRRSSRRTSAASSAPLISDPLQGGINQQDRGEHSAMEGGPQHAPHSIGAEIFEIVSERVSIAISRDSEMLVVSVDGYS